jgi:hypothetical protein
MNTRYRGDRTVDADYSYEPERTRADSCATPAGYANHQRVLLAFVIFTWLTSSAAVAQTICPANGNDQVDDSAALQSCLNAGGTIVLDADVQYGYYIGQTLFLTQPGTILRSVSNNGYRALLSATSDLQGEILQGNASDYRIERIWFSGNRFGRPARDSNCANWGNVVLRGSFVVDDIETSLALCGSGMSVEGTFEIRNSWFANNGFPKTQYAFRWADGLTVWNCEGGSIHHNNFIDNTDIDLIVGGGHAGACSVSDNTIQHNMTYGFAGLMIGRFNGGDGDHSSMTYTRNNVSSTFNNLGAGIMVGDHPWDVNSQVTNIGTVMANSSTGAVVNLLIDGILAGTFSGNTAANAQGTDGLANCTKNADYTAYDYGSANIQGGSIARYYHNSVCN